MAKKKTSKTTSSKVTPEGSSEIQLPIEYHFPEEQTGRFANCMTVQQDGHEFHLSFFEIIPPLTAGTAEERMKQLQDLESIRATCVARIIVSGSRMPGIVKVLEDQLQKYLAVKSTVAIEEETSKSDIEQSNGRKRGE